MTGCMAGDQRVNVNILLLSVANLWRFHALDKLADDLVESAILHEDPVRTPSRPDCNPASSI